MKIICIGSNYRLSDKTALPYIFLKPETALIRNSQPFFYPDFSSQITIETNLIIKTCRLGKHIQPKFAHLYYDEIAIGINFKALDLFKKLSESGCCTDLASSFDGSIAISNFIKIKEFENLNQIKFFLNNNKQLVQQCSSSEMIMDFDKIISFISQYITLKIGDIIFTGGLPAGEIKIGDFFEASIENRTMLECKIK